MNDGTKSGGQVAFEAYAQQSEGVSLVSGAKLPVWDMLPQDIRDAWEAADQASVSNYQQRLSQENKPG